MEGEVIAGRYEIRSLRGTGGMASVFVAWDQRLNREVAIKVLASKQCSEEARYFFNREAHSAAWLTHDAIVRIYDYSGPEESPPFIVMELIDGEALHVVIRERNPIPEEVIFAIAFRIASALAHAHDAGVIHRDIKPENVLLATDGRVILTDFGLAKAYTEPGRLGQSLAQRATNLYGTAEYLAPEQILSKDAGPTSDAFALGSTIYAVATGFSPFIDSNPIDVMNRIVDVIYHPLDQVRSDLSSTLSELIDSLLRLEPKQRLSCKKVADICHGWLRDHDCADVPELIQHYLLECSATADPTSSRGIESLKTVPPANASKIRKRRYLWSLALTSGLFAAGSLFALLLLRFGVCQGLR